MNNKPVILITGDVLIDHHIYLGERNSSSSIQSLGTHIKKTNGGAGLLYKMLEVISHQRNHNEKAVPFRVQFGYNKTIFGKLYTNLHRYALWKPCPLKAGSDHFVWRMARTLGYGHLNTPFFPYSAYISNASNQASDILVINDSGLGFRHNTEVKAWPGMLQNRKKDSPEWIVLKMSKPLGQGDLWRLLSTEYKDRLITIVSIDDIREEEVKISRGISWERTALDLTRELLFNPAINQLLASKYLIVRLGTEGALLVKKDGNHKKFRLFYDPAFMEGEWLDQFSGMGLGYMTCFTAGMVACLIQSGERMDFNKGIQAGLSTMRTMHINGHGYLKTKQNGRPAGFPMNGVVQDIHQPHYHYSNIALPVPEDPGESNHNNWTIMTACLEGAKKNPRPLYGVGRRVALIGPKALADIPYARFGDLLTVDRNEIESLRNVSKLILDYEKKDKGKKPLSMAVFGPPGSGKSFGIVQIAEGIFGKNVPILEFNLSQFSNDPGCLIGAFHQVRDKVLEGTTPIVFWDEFDSKEYFWLQYLLAPMQDGKFQEGQITHPIGKCIFIFAGGTSLTMENFGPRKEESDQWQKFQLKKGPDFISRLSGYLNVLGPNRRQYFDLEINKWQEDDNDICFPVRRALLMRSMLRLKETDYLNIDHGMLSAFIEIDKYKHGSRSLDKIISQVKRPEQVAIRRSDLPSPEIISLHVDYDQFVDIINRDLKFRTHAEILAPFVHACYRKLGRKEKWLKQEMDVDYENLSEDYKEDNRAAAERIHQVLDLIGLYVVPESYPVRESEKEIKSLMEQNIELLAEAEHKGWMDQKRRNGWTPGRRNDARKTHNCLIAYAQLSEADKEKDRNSVRKYVDILKAAKYKIVFTLNTGSHE
ncbi:hypothetical protein JW835_06875 [bacterium]|nr:hypothetical protein [bacterium]